jgi:hypothetical protein
MIKAWWAKLTQAGQKKYIAAHPGSDLAKKVKAGTVKIGSLKQAEEATKAKRQTYQNQLLHLHQRYRKLQASGGSKAKAAKLLSMMAIVKHNITSLNH